MEQKLIDAAKEYAKSLWKCGMYNSSTPANEEDMRHAFIAGAEWKDKKIAELREKLDSKFRNSGISAPTFIPFPKSQLKEMQEYEWQKYRMEVAKSIHRMLASERIDNLNADVIREIAATAVITTDALIAELKKTEK